MTNESPEIAALRRDLVEHIAQSSRNERVLLDYTRTLAKELAVAQDALNVSISAIGAIVSALDQQIDIDVLRKDAQSALDALPRTSATRKMLNRVLRKTKGGLHRTGGRTAPSGVLQ